ncbi:MAG: MarR family transcriptional regulator [Candidatus Omnitrophica bacterium]|jgi:MarR family 2-MHQ and catechol resistance regulon transcriptional repressor|nr:MarR family transcriptional regulator [bacterium]MDD4956000.1 MarR family transcriptional regulator [Candidatus Omnitrophota bacterium]
MSLQRELKLPQPFQNKKHEALLNILRTASLLSKRGDSFFSKYEVTMAQFNLLMVLKYSGLAHLTQSEIAERLLVNRANITGLIDRLEKTGLVERMPDKKDRRHYFITFTSKGRKTVDQIEQAYDKEVNLLMRDISDAEASEVIRVMEKLREPDAL